MSVLGYMKPACAMADPWLMTWYRASSSSVWDVSKIFTKPSVLEERSKAGSVGCNWRDVTVSVWDSRNERKGADVLRWSLVYDQNEMHLA